MGFKDIIYSWPQQLKSYLLIVFYIEQSIVIFLNQIILSYINPGNNMVSCLVHNSDSLIKKTTLGRVITLAN